MPWPRTIALVLFSLLISPSCHFNPNLAPLSQRPLDDYSRTPLEDEVHQISLEIAAPVEKAIVDLKRTGTDQQVYYEAKDVISVVTLAKQRLLSYLQRREFAGLRQYVEKFFPQPKLEGVEVARARRGIQDSFALLGGSGSGLVRVSNARWADQQPSTNQTSGRVKEWSAADALRQAYRFVIDKLSYYRSRPFQVDFNVATIPGYEHARVEILFSSGPPVHIPSSGSTNDSLVYTTYTDNPVKGIYRGLYIYKITPSKRYQPIEEPLNLVDEDFSLLECLLTPQGSRDKPLPCAKK
jgi:hypothetical protein